MTWIKTVAYTDAAGRLRTLYDRIKGPDDNVDNIMLAHSLRPHTLEGHMTLYKYVLHHPRNTVPKWFLEALGVLTSHMNGCAYCVEHHFEGMKRLVSDDARSASIRRAIENGDYEATFEPKEMAALDYAGKLTESPAEISEDDIRRLRRSGWDDGQILEINQVVSYFSYANRTVQGLGVSTKGDILGLSPSNSDDIDNWEHR